MQNDIKKLTKEIQVKSNKFLSRFRTTKIQRICEYTNIYKKKNK